MKTHKALFFGIRTMNKVRWLSSGLTKVSWFIELNF